MCFIRNRYLNSGYTCMSQQKKRIARKQLVKRTAILGHVNRLLANFKFAKLVKLKKLVISLTYKSIQRINTQTYLALQSYNFHLYLKRVKQFFSWHENLLSLPTSSPFLVFWNFFDSNCCSLTI